MASPKKPEKFKAGDRLQREYEKSISRIVKRVLTPQMPEETLDQWLARLAARTREKDVQEASEFVARKMVHWASVKNARTWREASAKSQRSRELYRLLQAELKSGPTGARVSQLVRENAAYIRSIPLDAAAHLTHEVARAQQTGARPATIDKMMRARFPELLRSRVHLISRTETQKASAALTRARAEDLGLNAYEWLSSKDQRTRKSHQKMNEVIVFYDDPPSPEELVNLKSVGHYHAGEIFNCRCSQVPLVSPAEVSWPHRVFHHGKIEWMTLVKFKQLQPGGAAESQAA